MFTILFYWRLLEFSFFLAGRFFNLAGNGSPPESTEQKLFCQQLKIILYKSVYLLFFPQMNANKLPHWLPLKRP